MDIEASQRQEPQLGIVVGLHCGAYPMHTPVGLLLQQGEEQILFAREMRVKGPASMSSRCGDILDPRGFKALAGEDAPRRSQERQPSRLRLLLVLVGTSMILKRSGNRTGCCAGAHGLTSIIYIHACTC